MITKLGKKIYKLAKQETLQKKDTVKRKMICINMAELYAYIAGEFGIDVQLQRQDYETQECYVFSKKNRRMTSITPEELYQMQNQSMEIRPVYTSEESNFQTRMIDESFKNFINKGKLDAEKIQQVDMEIFFNDEYD